MITIELKLTLECTLPSAGNSWAYPTVARKQVTWFGWIRNYSLMPAHSATEKNIPKNLAKNAAIKSIELTEKYDQLEKLLAQWDRGNRSHVRVPRGSN
jgi:hypothetical protein